MMMAMIQEMEYTDRLRKEIEEEKKRIIEAAEAVEDAGVSPPRMENLGALDIPLTDMTDSPPPQFSRFAPSPSPVASSSSHPNFYEESGGQVMTSAGRGRDLASTEYGVGAPVKQYEDVLRPGNYLLCCWDSEAMSGNVDWGKLYGIGAYMPHGPTFHEAILPDASEEELMNNKNFVKHGALWFVKGPDFRLVHTVTTEMALNNFLTFLEKGCQSSRPSYDGVILLSHLQESIPTLLKTVKKLEISERFNKVVKGVGDLCSYLAQCHMKKFMGDYANTGKMDLSLPAVTEAILKQRMSKINTVEKNAYVIYQVLERLLECKPTYSNFYCKYILSLKSKEVERLANYRTVRERLELFLPLRQYIAQELAAQQGELFIEGLYAPTKEDSDKILTEPQQVAVAMCRTLISSSFDFDRLLNLYTDQGLAVLELTVRTAFLDKMAGQPRALVDQAVRTTRLVVSFFKQHGHRPIEDLVMTAKETELMEDRLKTSAEETSQKHINKLDQINFRKKFESYKPLAEYMTRRLSKKSPSMALATQKSADEVKIMVDMLINCLVKSGIEFEQLKEMYAEDKQKFKHRNNLRAQLVRKLASSYRDHGPQDIEASQFINLMIDFCGNEVFNRPSTSNPVSDRSQQLEEARVSLDKAISENQMYDSEFRIRLYSLAAIKMFLVQKLEPIIVFCGGNPDQVRLIAEHVQKLVSFLGYDHGKLKGLFGMSDAHLAGNLFASLREKPGLLPPGFTNETLVEYIVEYFKLQEGK